MPMRKGTTGASGIRPGGIVLTKNVIRAAYSFLHTTEPFNEWSELPSADDVIFRVTRSHNEAGHCDVAEDGDIIIALSSRLHGYSQSILTTVAHEMIHAVQFIRGEPTTHGAGFLKLARQVCKHHGFDLKGF